MVPDDWCPRNTSFPLSTWKGRCRYASKHDEMSHRTGDHGGIHRKNVGFDQASGYCSTVNARIGVEDASLAHTAAVRGEASERF
jgi:hypothetical protein